MRTNILIFVIVVTLLLLSAEVYFRFTTHCDVKYYAIPSSFVPNTTNIHPYGEIPVNSLGYPDSEFDLASNQVRVGYIGDSVNYGLGAGYPYRISERMEELLSHLERWNIGRGPGKYLNQEDLDNAKAVNVDKLIYFLI